MEKISKHRLYEEINSIEDTGNIAEMAERFREYVNSEERLKEEMYSDFEKRTKEYIYLIDDYRIILGRYKRRYKRLKISYITLFIIIFFCVLYYLFVVKYALINIELPVIGELFGI